MTSETWQWSVKNNPQVSFTADKAGPASALVLSEESPQEMSQTSPLLQTGNQW